MTLQTKRRAVVVGAGIIGAAIAFQLQKRGREVTLIDRDEPGRGASFGNMASIAITEFMPVARPAIYKQMPAWLIDPEGPIRIDPLYLPRLTPWFLKFVTASLPSRVRRIEAHGAALCDRALQDTEVLLQEIGLEEHLSSTGCLTLYADENEFKADRERIEMLDRYNFEYEIVGTDALRDMEPEISSVIKKAVLLPNNRTLRDPYLLVQRLIDVVLQAGGSLIRAEVTNFQREESAKRVHLNNGNILEADEVVICAGAYSGELSKMLGESIPLETERGYSTLIKRPEISINHSMIWPTKAFMISPTAGGIRVGGTVEMAGLQKPPNYSRAKVTVRHAQEALPNLVVKDATEWMGHRPALPDTVPILSASSQTKGVYYATGHGHLGLTNAATSAYLMGQLIDGETPDIDLTPYNINRF